MKRKVAAIGIDAAEWRHLEALITQGRLPNIEKHLAQSNVLEMSAEMPYRAEATWTEFLTGRAPGDHKYWSTAVFDPDTYEVWEVGAHRGVPFYARPDLKSIVFDVPHSHIAPEAHGVQVTAWGAHSPQFPTASSPRHVAAEIDQKFGIHKAPLSDSYIGWHNADFLRNLTDAMLDGLEKKAAICGWLLEEHPDWDLFLTVLSESHTAGHEFLHGVLEDHLLASMPLSAVAADYYNATYEKIDEVVGRLLATVGDDVHVMLFAVHGMWENGSDTAAVWLPEGLHRRIFGAPFIDFPAWHAGMAPVDLEPTMSPLEYLLRRVTEPVGDMYGSRKTGLKNRVAWELRRRAPAGTLEGLQGLARRVMGSHHQWWEMKVRPPADPSIDLAAAGSRTPSDYHVPGWYCRYWPQMPYFVLPSFSDVHLRVNLAGRERDGRVDRGDYHHVLDQAESFIRGITDARTGKAVVADMYRVRADDPMDPDGPTADLVVMCEGVTDVVDIPGVGLVGPTPLFRSGEHSDRGWAALRSPGGDTRALGKGRPRDLGPTILDLLGRPPSPLITGRSVADRLRGE